MISEYMDNVRNRLHTALLTNDEREAVRLQALMAHLMRDADAVGEPMPWDKWCPLCGSIITAKTGDEQ
jgi:hypothetical protein